MISRRSFLGLTAATLATAVPLARSAYAATPDTFGLELVNNSGSGTVYAYVTGTTPDGRLVLLRADGTPYYPASRASTSSRTRSWTSSSTRGPTWCTRAS
jgi:hypothetical protein